MKLINIEAIIKAIKPEIKKVIKLSKYDGITMECFVENSKDIDKGIKEMEQICTKLDLIPIATEISKNKDNVFIIQFPELNPAYTDNQIKKMYKLTFKWLLDNLLKTDVNKKVTKDILLKFKSIVVKEAIQTFCRSNINLYKDNAINYLNNKNYKEKIDLIYLDFLETYEYKK